MPRVCEKILVPKQVTLKTESLLLYAEYLIDVIKPTEIPQSKLLVPNFIEPIEQGQKTAAELYEAHNDEVNKLSAVECIAQNRREMQKIQVFIELSKLTNKFEIANGIGKLADASTVCEDQIVSTYGAYLSLKDTIEFSGKKVIRNWNLH